MFYPSCFNLNKDEIMLIDKVKNIMLTTNWCMDGAAQEKGLRAERLVLELLSLCNNVEVIATQKSSVLDEVLKVDIILKIKDSFQDVYAFQVKSSMTGAQQHYSKYAPFIKYKNYYFRAPWCLIIDGSLSNWELFELIIEELLLETSLDFDKLSFIERNKEHFGSNVLE